MHELKFLGKEPLRNAPDHFDQRRPTTELAFMQVRIPTYFCHFWFSPCAPLFSFDYALDFDGDAYCSIMHTLESARRCVDGTLLASVRKHCMRRVEQFCPQHREQLKRLAVELKRRRGKVDLVRLRYAYCIRKYQMVTQLAGHFGAHRHAESAPLYISPSALGWFLTQDLGRCPFELRQLSTLHEDGFSQLRLQSSLGEQQLPVYYLSSPGLEPGTHDHLALCHAAMALAAPGSDWLRADVNWHLAMRGLTSLLASEAQAFCSVLKCLRSHTGDPGLTPAEALLVVKRHYSAHRESCAAAAARLVARDSEARNSLQLTTRQWRHHSQLDLGDVDADLLFSPKLYLRLAEQWLQAQGVESLLARPRADARPVPGRQLLLALARSLAGDREALADWPAGSSSCFSSDSRLAWSLPQLAGSLEGLALHQCELLSGHLAMSCPAFVVAPSKSSHWRELQSLEADMPQCSELLHRLIEKARSQEFEDELGSTVDRLKRSPTFRVSSTGRAALHACTYLLQQVDVNLRSCRPDSRETRLRQLLKEATTLRIDQAFPVVEASRQEAVARAAKRLSFRLLMSDDPPLAAVQQAADWLAQYYEHGVEALSQALLKAFALSSPLVRDQLQQFRAQCVAAARRQDDARSDMVLKIQLAQRPAPRLMLALGRAALKLAS